MWTTLQFLKILMNDAAQFEWNATTQIKFPPPKKKKKQ